MQEESGEVCVIGFGSEVRNVCRRVKPVNVQEVGNTVHVVNKAARVDKVIGIIKKW